MKLKILSLITLLIFSSEAMAEKVQERVMTATPQPPIPYVNTKAFKEYVRTHHSFPSPFGYESFLDSDSKPLSYPIKSLNKKNPYIPVTFYCNSRDICPTYVDAKPDQIRFVYPDGQFLFLFARTWDASQSIPIIQGFYMPNNPILFTGNEVIMGGKPFPHPLGEISYGDPIVTILFSQPLLEALHKIGGNGQVFGFLAAHEKGTIAGGYRIFGALSDGNESLKLGTTLSLIGFGQTSGVQVTESVTKTTGESFTQQVQTGFTLSTTFEAGATLGGGEIPFQSSYRASVNKTLSKLNSNSVTLSDQTSHTISYTFSPGIKNTYYWAIYQLMYSYYFDAPLFEEGLKNIQNIWQNLVSFKIATNDKTAVDKKNIGNLLPPPVPGGSNDVTIPVAVEVYPGASGSVKVCELLAAKVTSFQY